MMDSEFRILIFVIEKDENYDTSKKIVKFLVITAKRNFKIQVI